jgi:hypothetical protein
MVVIDAHTVVLDRDLTSVGELAPWSELMASHEMELTHAHAAEAGSIFGVSDVL